MHNIYFMGVIILSTPYSTKQKHSTTVFMKKFIKLKLVTAAKIEVGNQNCV